MTAAHPDSMASPLAIAYRLKIGHVRGSPRRSVEDRAERRDGISHRLSSATALHHKGGRSDARAFSTSNGVADVKRGTQPVGMGSRRACPVTARGDDRVCKQLGGGGCGHGVCQSHAPRVGASVGQQPRGARSPHPRRATSRALCGGAHPRRTARWYTWEATVRRLLGKLEYQARLQSILGDTPHRLGHQGPSTRRQDRSEVDQERPLMVSKTSSASRVQPQGAVPADVEAAAT